MKKKSKKLKFRAWFMTLLWVLMIADVSIGYTATRLMEEQSLPSPTVTVPHKKPIIAAPKPAGKWVIREATAYNVGDPNQNDASPCIGAHANLDLCKLVAAGKLVIATNAYPFHTKLYIEGLGVG